MKTLPKTLADEIEGLEELDARALKKKYPALLSDAAECAASGILRSIVAYRLQERHYGRPLAEDARSWLEADDGGDGPRLRSSAPGSGARARLVRVWKGVRHEAVVRNDGRFEYGGQMFNSLSAIAKAITGTHWNGRLFFGIKYKEDTMLKMDRETIEGLVALLASVMERLRPDSARPARAGGAG